MVDFNFVGFHQLFFNISLFHLKNYFSKDVNFKFLLKRSIIEKIIEKPFAFTKQFCISQLSISSFVCLIMVTIIRQVFTNLPNETLFSCNICHGL